MRRTTTRLLLWLLLSAGAVLGMRHEHWPAPTRHLMKRQVQETGVIVAASEGLAWYTHATNVTLTWDAVTQFAAGLDASAGLNEATAGAIGIDCALRFAAQGDLVPEGVLQVTCLTNASDTGEALASILGVPGVQFVRDGVLHNVSTTQSVSQAGQWNLDRLDQRSLPRNNAYTYWLTGAGVSIYIADTGCINHNDFTGRRTFLANLAGDGVNTDCHGHGTHCAGSAAGNNYGVAKGASIYCIKVLDCSGSGTYSAVIAALVLIADRLAEAAHMVVVSMSLAGPVDSGTNAAVNAFVNSNKGAVVVAAGNNAGSACSLTPASASAALTVAATTTTDTLASFSNYGSCTDIAAPGKDILSAWGSSVSATATLSGTSMATPLVAGVVALEMQRRYIASGNVTLPNAAACMAAVVAMATANKISTPSGAKLPLVFSSLGMPPVPVPAPAPPQSPVPTPGKKSGPSGPPRSIPAPPRRRLGRVDADTPAASSGAETDLPPFVGVALVIVFLIGV